MRLRPRVEELVWWLLEQPQWLRRAGLMGDQRKGWL